MAATVVQNLLTTPTLHVTIGPAQTRQTTHLATAATIVWNLPTTPTSCASCAALVEFTHDTHKSHVMRCARPLAKHNTNKKLAMAATIVWNLPTHPQSRTAPAQRKYNTNKSRQRPQTWQWPQRLCGIYPHTPQSFAPNPNTIQRKAGNGHNDCAEFTHTPTKSCSTSAAQTQHKQKPAAAPNTATAATIVWNLPTHPTKFCPKPKHNTKKSQQWPQQLCGIYPRTHKLCCTIAPNTTTQTKASNGRNDCAEFTHAPTKLRCTIAPNQTQHKQKPAMAATIVRNLPMYLQLRCMVIGWPKHKHKQKTIWQRPH